jgi:hypothetical protein
VWLDVVWLDVVWLDVVWLDVVWLDVAVGVRADAKRTSATSATPAPRH